MGAGGPNASLQRRPVVGLRLGAEHRRCRSIVHPPDLVEATVKDARAALDAYEQPVEAG